MPCLGFHEVILVLGLACQACVILVENIWSPLVFGPQSTLGDIIWQIDSLGLRLKDDPKEKQGGERVHALSM